MNHRVDPQAGWPGIPSRPLFWSIPFTLLLLPLTAMQFTGEVAWTLADFVVAGMLFALSGAALELAVRKMNDARYRGGVALAVCTAAFLIVANGAVGIIGSENNDANVLYGAVTATLVVGAAIARFRARGMAFALVTTALAQVAVPVIALAGDFGPTGPISVWDVVMITTFFVSLWLAAAWLFGRVARAEVAGR